MQIFTRERRTESTPRSIVLRFDPELRQSHGGVRVRSELSVVEQVGRDLWLGSDEATSIERLSPGEKSGFEEHVCFPLTDYLDLPAGNDTEVDIEGMAFADPYLWIVGSHSRKRGKADPQAGDPQKQIRKLAKVEREANRYLLARIPLVSTEDGTTCQPYKACPDPADPEQTLSAAILAGRKKGNQLTDALRHDKHLAPFLRIPGKDNGFDIEGLAVADGRLFLGLRGPVLRGWAVVLEIQVEADGPSLLRLKPIGRKGRPYRKHFLDLRGLGIRELCADGADLLILAGPTMQLDGDAAVFRWAGAAEGVKDSLVGRDLVDKVLDLPYGRGEHEDLDHPEGLTRFSEDGGRPSVLVVYDSPKPERRVGGNGIRADIFELP